MLYFIVFAACTLAFLPSTANCVLVISTSSLGHVNPCLSIAKDLNLTNITLLTFGDFAIYPIESLIVKPNNFIYAKLTTTHNLYGIKNIDQRHNFIQQTLNTLLDEVVPMYEEAKQVLKHKCPNIIIVDSITLGGWIAASEYCSASQVILSKMDFFEQPNMLANLYQNAKKLLLKESVILSCAHQVINQYAGFFQSSDTFYNCSQSFYHISLEENLKRDEISNMYLNPPLLYINLGTTFIPPQEVLDEVAKALAVISAKTSLEIIWANPFAANYSLMPQTKILCSNRTVIFISGGGSNGINEAFYCNVPMIIWPQNYDQFDQALRINGKFGVGFWDSIPTHSCLVSSVQQILRLYHFYSKNIESLVQSSFS